MRRKRLEWEGDIPMHQYQEKKQIKLEVEVSNRNIKNRLKVVFQYSRLGVIVDCRVTVRDRGV